MPHIEDNNLQKISVIAVLITNVNWNFGKTHVQQTSSDASQKCRRGICIEEER